MCVCMCVYVCVYHGRRNRNNILPTKKIKSLEIVTYK